MARPKAATFDTQRATIRDAAARLFAEKGYASTSIADIAAACDVSKALLYHYYRDKEHLLHDIAASYVERLQAIVAEVQAERLPAAAMLRLLIVRFMAEYEHSVARHRVLVQDVKYLSRLHRTRVVAGQREVVAEFAEAIARVSPLMGEDWQRPLAMILFGMMNWTFTWLRDDGTLRHEDLAPVIADLFIGGLGRVRPPQRTQAVRRPRSRAASTLKASA
ncbi:MAG TPA: TetR/AcrR family transcriptional regulator [Burkholderiaceae bacterium]|nr:TetR/AcrR family transcriptional regulator [Burkholderiaceae bacterium]